MLRSLFAICLLLTLGVGAVATVAQDVPIDGWKASADGTLEYNCAVLVGLFADQASLGANADQIVARSDGTELTLREFVGGQTLMLLSENANRAVSFDSLFAAAQQVCAAVEPTAQPTGVPTTARFMVIVNGNVNLRSCGSTDCSIVGSAADGSMLEVVGESGDWYQVRHEGGTAFVAARLTTRGPDRVIDIDNRYFDPHTRCVVLFDIKRGDMGISILLSGRHQDEVLVDLYRPHENNPIPVTDQFDKLFLDTNEPYIDQYYYSSVGWPLGTYLLEITLDDETSRLAWELETRGDYNIYIDCNV